MAEITLASIDRVMKKAGVSRISNSGKTGAHKQS